jgi:phospholipase C
MSVRSCVLSGLLCGFAGALWACGGGDRIASQPSVPPQGAAPNGRAGVSSGKIQHVVIVIQDHRSLNNLFFGYPGAGTVAGATNHLGRHVRITPASLSASNVIEDWDRDHLAACDGSGGKDCTMDGFDLENQYPANSAFHYVPHSETRPLFSIARQYVLASRMFASNIDDSFVSHQYYIAAQAADTVDVPTGKWGCGGGADDVLENLRGKQVRPCFDYRTLADELDAAQLSWRYYAAPLHDDGGIWSAFQAVHHIYRSAEWSTNVIAPETRFLSDVANGELATVTWITPSRKNSDVDGAGGGPRWVASVVNAVGESPFWSSTAIFVVWSDWGGYYDPVPPPPVDDDGLGFRVPMLAVSPYAKRGYVSPVQYENGSILRFVEDTYGLQALSASDARANDPATDCFDFNQKPRAFKPISMR